jgi:hypothetical protein
MEFSSPATLLLVAPWMLLVAVFYRTQGGALRALGQNTAPRFRSQFTSYHRGMLAGHAVALLAMGVLVICAAAAPTTAGTGHADESAASVILVVDCSDSMGAHDANKIPGMPAVLRRREEASALAEETVRKFPQARFGLVSFAGSAVVHAAPTIDHDALLTYLKESMVAHEHDCGTDFKAALGSIIRLAERTPENGCEAIIFSDGEAQNGNDYSAELATLKRKGIRCHCVGVGTAKGKTLVINWVRETGRQSAVGETLTPVHKEITGTGKDRTRRMDKDLEQIAKATGGSYIVPENGGTLQDIFKAVERTPVKPRLVSRMGRVDMSWSFLLAFMFLFLADNLVFDGFKFWAGVRMPEARRT